MEQTVRLSSVPASPRTLLRAFATAFKRPRHAPRLPVYTMENLQPDPERLRAFKERFGYTGPFVPSTYWHTRLFGVRILLSAHKNFPFPLPGMVHLTDTIRQHHPVSPGDSLRMECRLGRMLAHEKGSAFETLTRLYRENTLVWEENTVNLHIGKTLFAEADYEPVAMDGLPAAHEQHIRIPGNMGRIYAGISGDFNPIHISTAGAKLFGFKRKLMHGWYGLNLILAQHPDIMAGPHEVYAAFKKPLYLPGDVMLRQQENGTETRFEIVDAKEGYPHLKGCLRKTATP